MNWTHGKAWNIGYQAGWLGEDWTPQAVPAMFFADYASGYAAGENQRLVPEPNRPKQSGVKYPEYIEV